MQAMLALQTQYCIRTETAMHCNRPQKQDKLTHRKINLGLEGVLVAH